MKYSEWNLKIAWQCEHRRIKDRDAALCKHNPDSRFQWCSFETCPLIPRLERREYS
jgi:hypothetical protein